jgi:hypothetical protein
LFIDAYIDLLLSCYIFNSFKYIHYVVGQTTRNTGDNSGANISIPDTSTVPNFIQGGYTGLLLGLDKKPLDENYFLKNPKCYKI